MEEVHKTIWQWIEEVPQRIPFTTTKVRALLQSPLVAADNAGNDLLDFWKGGKTNLLGGVQIAAIDLRIKEKGPDVGFLIVHLAGACITLPDVRAHYADVNLTDYPRGRSLDEVTSYSSERPWGELSFSFTERKPDCLARVAFDPRQ